MLLYLLTRDMGKSFRISSVVIPAAIISNTPYTLIRIPRTIDFPANIPALLVILLSKSSIAKSFTIDKQMLPSHLGSTTYRLAC